MCVCAHSNFQPRKTKQYENAYIIHKRLTVKYGRLTRSFVHVCKSTVSAAATTTDICWYYGRTIFFSLFWETGRVVFT